MTVAPTPPTAVPGATAGLRATTEPGSTVDDDGVARVGHRAGVLPSLSLALADPAVREIVIEPGEYVEHIVIAPRSAPLLIRSATGRAEDVRIVFCQIGRAHV